MIEKSNQSTSYNGILSIIVPIYNSENYLEQCINSLLRQTYRNIEIILVDDGSTDRSGGICDIYEKKDARIKVVHKKNGGVSSARNVGIHIASGEYVIFVDSDDWLDEDACQKIAGEIEEPYEWYLWSSKRFTNSQVKKAPPMEKWDSYESLIADIISTSRNPYLRAPWAKVYLRTKLEQVQFPENIYIGEDACLLLDYVAVLSSLEAIKVINDGWYYYRDNPNSAVNKYKPDLLNQSILQYTYIKNKIKEFRLGNSEYINSAMCRLCWSLFLSLKKNKFKSCEGQKDNDDCKIFSQVADKWLSYSKINSRMLPKSRQLFWIMYRIFGENITEKVVGIYVKFKQGNYKHNNSSL